MDIPAIIKLSPSKWYKCACGERYRDLLDACLHVGDDGFCEKGIRLYDEKNDKYECRCGTTNMHRFVVELRHVYDNRGRCIKRKELEDLTTCDTCNKKFHTIAWYERHCQTLKHNARLETPALDLECKICDIKCSSQKQMKTHLDTKKHKEREQTHEIPLELECKICNTKCRGQKEMKKHLETKKHLKKVTQANPIITQ